MEVETRHNRSLLPPIEPLDMDRIKTDEAAYQARNSGVQSAHHSAAAMDSPSSPYARRGSFSRDSSNSASRPNISSTFSNSDSYTSYERRESAPRRSPPPPPLSSASHPPPSAPVSLPSIHEALGASPTLSQLHHPPPTPSAPQPLYSNPPPRSPESIKSRPKTPSQEYHRSSSTYSSHTQNPPQMNSTTPSSQYSYPHAPRSPVHNTYTSRAPEFQPPPLSQTQSSTSSQNHFYAPSWSSQQSNASESLNPSYARLHENSHQDEHIQNYSTKSNGITSGQHTSSWRTSQMDMPPPEDTKIARRVTYGESVKRHLDVFDLESSLNEISESSKQIMDFSAHYSHRAHQTQRSGPLPGSTPHLNEIDDMIKQARQIRDSLDRLKTVVISQQEALAKRSKESASKASNGAGSDHEDSYHDSNKGGGGFAGPDPKKRRGRAAPPGRCHSCNRAETPEWRRGPDGARTLCNACGLHYAKLTRKMGAGKASAMSSSSLRPNSIAPGSP